MLNRLGVATAALALTALALTGCSATSSGPVKGTHAPAAAAKVTPTPSATPTPVAALGARANPFPVGTPGKYASDSMWTVTFASTNPNGWPVMQAANEFNTAPPTGDDDVIGTLTVDAGQAAPSSGADPSASWTVAYVGSDGNSYPVINHPCGASTTTDLQDAGTMYAGATRSVTVCAQVPASAAPGGTWSVAYVDDPTQVAFFKGA